MNANVAAAAAAIGYAIGSISVARLVARRVAPHADLERIEVPLSSGEVFTSTTVSATTVRLAAGTRYGLATGFLDMAKVAVPTVVVRRLRPDDSTHLIVAAGGLVGHDLPLYHRFRGGRGESPIIGVMLALDPAGLLVTQALGIAAGLVVGDIVVLRWGGMALLVPWEAFVRRNRPLATWMLFADLVYLAAMRRELMQYVAMVRSGRTPSHEEITREYGMGAGLGRFIDRYSLRALIARRRAAPPLEPEAD